jgi:hypothetical protein
MRRVPGGNRTPDLLLRKQPLYPLGYEDIVRERGIEPPRRGYGFTAR